jgi:hypothetical protein
MPSPELERLADLHHLKREPPSREEMKGLIRSGATRLADAQNEAISAESRFDLAYNAAHALALAALRSKGYRAEKRYFVFQVLPHTLGTPASTWRLLAKCHEQRNRTEYEGWSDVDQALVDGLIQAAQTLLKAVRALPLPAEADHER